MKTYSPVKISLFVILFGVQLRTCVFILLLISLFLFNYLLLLTNDQFITSADLEKLNGIKVIQSKFYSGDDVYDYIDGAADLYFEYGFLSVSVFKVNYKDIDFTIEYHKHNAQVNAFGLMSVYNYDCDSATKNINFLCSCSNPYFLSFVSGNYFIRIINNDGSSLAMQTAIIIGNYIKSSLQGNECKYPDLFLQDKLINNLRNLKYICGPLGIQNILPGWERYLTGIKSYQIYSTEVSENDFNAVISFIEFGSDTDVVKFDELNSKCNDIISNDWIKEIGARLIKYKASDQWIIIKDIQSNNRLLILSESPKNKILDFVMSLKF